MFNTAYYKNDLVDNNIAKALNTTDKAEIETLYKAAQQQIWDDAPWVFLVTEKLLYARSKNLSGIYVMPDASYEYEEIDVK
jgi:glutathione transport system substrate-binding protein